MKGDSMKLDERLQRVAVIGAAGKMGSGISLLLAREMAWRALEAPAGAPRLFALKLIDVNAEALQGLKRYLWDQAIKDGEKQIHRLRRAFAAREDLVENGEMIEAFAREVLVHVDAGTEVELARGASLVFEAAFEREDLKVDLFRRLQGLCPEAWFLSNTSSIPLGELDRAAGLGGRLIGCHFYNPPAVQRLLEVITPEGCDPELAVLTLELARVLGKTVVEARDVAGFIGNGHFMRDGLHGLRMAEGLGLPLPEALWKVDRATQAFLLRPMGILQLIDYVGIDVFQLILRVMEGHLQEGLHSPLVDRMLAAGIRGGQASGGLQRDGFFRYDKGRITGVYDLTTGAYQAIDPTWDGELGARPPGDLGWKALAADPGRDAHLASWFRALQGLEGLGARLALAQQAASRDVALRLVAEGVAADADAVNQVLCLGFFHLYGPVNPFFEGGVA